MPPRQLCDRQGVVDVYIARWQAAGMGGVDAWELSLERAPISCHLTRRPDTIHRIVDAFQQRIRGASLSGACVHLCTCVYCVSCELLQESYQAPNTPCRCR